MFARPEDSIRITDNKNTIDIDDKKINLIE